MYKMPTWSYKQNHERIIMLIPGAWIKVAYLLDRTL